MIGDEGKGWFMRNPFRNSLMAGIIAGGCIGWFVRGWIVGGFLTNFDRKRAMVKTNRDAGK